MRLKFINVMTKKWIIYNSGLAAILILILVASDSLPDKIRTIRVDNRKMQTIQLRMGRASVLRFSETPKKVVIGNQNYHSVEFIDNDITIQPLGRVKTNLFVYTPHHTYGFLLDVCDHCQYDDFLHVKWKPNSLRLSLPSSQKQKKDSKKLAQRFHSIDLELVVGNSLLVKVGRTMAAPKHSLRTIDLQIKNKGVLRENIESLQVLATRKGKPLAPQSYVVGKDKLENHESSKARLFISSKEKKAFTLHVTCGDQKGQAIIQGKFLR